MDVALQVYVFRRGPPPRAVVSTPSPPASESVLRASILRIEKVQGRSRIKAPRHPTGWLGDACSSRVRWCGPHQRRATSGHARERKAAMTRLASASSGRFVDPLRTSTHQRALGAVHFLLGCIAFSLLSLAPVRGALAGGEVCPDGGSCPDGSVCCRFSEFQYTC